MMTENLQKVLEGYEIELDDFRESYRNALTRAKTRLGEREYADLTARLEEAEQQAPWKVVAWVGVQYPPLAEDRRFGRLRRLLREQRQT